MALAPGPSQGIDKPMFDLRNHYGQLSINGGENLRSQMIKVSGGTSTFFSTMRIKNGRYKVRRSAGERRRAIEKQLLTLQ